MQNSTRKKRNGPSLEYDGPQYTPTALRLG
jgi:hypothetical protein